VRLQISPVAVLEPCLRDDIRHQQEQKTGLGLGFEFGFGLESNSRGPGSGAIRIFALFRALHLTDDRSRKVFALHLALAVKFPQRRFAFSVPAPAQRRRRHSARLRRAIRV